MSAVDTTALRGLFRAMGTDGEAANRLFLEVYRLCALVERGGTYPLARPAGDDEELLLAGKGRAACVRFFGEIALGWETLPLSDPALFLGSRGREVTDIAAIDAELGPSRSGCDPASDVLTSFIAELGAGSARNAVLQELEASPPWGAALTCINRGIERRTQAPWAQERLRQTFRLAVQDFLRLHAVSMLLGDPMAERTAPIVGMLHECVPLLARRAPLRLVVLIG